MLGTLRATTLLIVAAFVSIAFVSDASGQIDIRGEITGRIMTDTGTPARRANVMVMDLTTLETRNVITNDFGYFRVNDLQFGNTFLVGASGKRYHFAFPYQTVTLNLISREVFFTANRFDPAVQPSGIAEPLVIVSSEP